MKRVTFILGSTAAAWLLPALAFAQDQTGAGATGARAIACGIAIGVAALGGGLGQGRVAAAALEGIARNPNAAGQMTTPLILGLAFVESLVLLAWLTIFLLKANV